MSLLITGFFIGGIQSTLYVWVNEFFDISMWGITTSIVSACWALGSIILGPIAYNHPNWRNVLKTTTIPFIPILLLICVIVPESPLWLCSMNKYEEAEKILYKMAKYNNSKKYKNIRNLECGQLKVVKIEKQSVSKAIYMQEYRSRIIRLTIAWFVSCASTYYLRV